MSRNYPRIAARLFNTPLLIEPATAETVSEVVLARMGIEVLIEPGKIAKAARKPAGMFFDDDDEPMAEEPPYRVHNGTAIVPIIGELVNRGSAMDALSGIQSYQGLRDKLAMAAEDPDVNGILLDMDSGGGEATGALETAAFVRQMSERKPVAAYVDGMACSAAYAIASGANKIVTTPSSVLGSIGVVTVHMDRSAAIERQGVKATIITSGEHKADYSSLQALSADARARIQKSSDLIYDLFTGTVSRHRNMDLSNVVGTKAGIFLGQSGVDVGLADEVGDIHAALKYASPLSRYVKGHSIMNASVASAAAPATAAFNGQPQPPAAAAAVEMMAVAQHEAIMASTVAGAQREADIAGFKAGATAERTRIKSILSHEAAAERPKLARHIAFNTSMTLEEGAGMLSEAAVEFAPAVMGQGLPIPQAAGDGRVIAEMAALRAPAISSTVPAAPAAVAGVPSAEEAYAEAAEIARKMLGKPAKAA